MGRPRKTLPSSGLDIIRALAANGVQEHQIAVALGVDFRTWVRIRGEDPEARAVWQEARALEQDKLVGSLFRQAMGTPAEYDEKGNVIRAEQLPIPTAAMFLLKARHQYRDFGPTDGSGDGRPTININIPAPLDAAAYGKLIQVAPNALPAPADREAA